MTIMIQTRKEKREEKRKLKEIYEKAKKDGINVSYEEFDKSLEIIKEGLMKMYLKNQKNESNKRG